MCIYWGMNLLGKIGVGFVMQKSGKKRDFSAKNRAGKVIFGQKRTQNEGTEDGSLPRRHEGHEE